MKIKWLCLCIVLCGMVVPAQDMNVIKGFSVPEFDREGNMTSMLFGDLAEFLPGGEIKITNLKIEFYDEPEAVSMTVFAPECVYAEKKKQAESDGSVRIVRDSMIVTGVGFDWMAEKEKMVIHSEARVVLKNARNQMKNGEKK